MSHDLRFQVLVIPNVPWPQYLDRFVQLEALGFEVAAVPDHFCDWGNPSGPWLEAWTGIAAIAASTSTIRLTTCVTQMPLRNPAVSRTKRSRSTTSPAAGWSWASAPGSPSTPRTT